MEEIWYNYPDGTRECAYSYEYDAYGQIYSVTDCLSGRVTVYKYDSNRRLVGVYEYDGAEAPQYDFSVNYTYNDRSELWVVHYSLYYPASGSTAIVKPSVSYLYNDDSTLKRENHQDYITDGRIDYVYDDFGRLSSTTQSMWVYDNTSQKLTIDSSFTYRTYGEGLTDGLVSGYTSTVNGTATTYAYEYDTNGNLTRVTLSDGTELRYYYDDIGQLVREDNGQINKTFVYIYDDAGNILSKSTYALTAKDVTPTSPLSTDTYTYGNEEWGDQLTAYNGTSITYDALGNPLSYYNGKDAYTFTWNVRQMASATLDGATYTFGYNADGLRTTKTVNGVTTEYIYNGSLLVAEITAGATVLYTYNANGVPIGMKYHGADYAAGAWDVYFYEHNIQGDIVAIYNLLGTKLVSYTYDAWGNFTVAYHNGGENTSVTQNPYTYRSYYFDTDLGLYYLQSRYYDQNIGRFVNADGYISTEGILGHNMYAYCANNPVMCIDSSGEWLRRLFRKIRNCFVETVKTIYTWVNHNHNSNQTINPDALENGYIVKQSLLTNFYYGFPTMDFNGCEIIAVYNARVGLGLEKKSLSYLIDLFNKTDAMIIPCGFLGSAPSKISRVLDALGMRYTKIYSEDQLNKKGSYIVSYWNGKEFLSSLHTMYMYYDGNEYIWYNYNVDNATITQPTFSLSTKTFILGYYLG
ncbi:MAG: hypothetical protein IJX38_05680 [Clostridia bacterium]|nr:hypothetical protein [Clostridia bacterium]